MENLETEYKRLVTMRRCGLSNVLASIKNIRKQMSLNGNQNPFSTVKSRIKTPASAYGKCKRKYGDTSVEGLRSLQDIAGVRIVTDFEDEIYDVRELLMQVPTFEVIWEDDYVAKPKPNGYRSLHLIVTVEIFFEGESCKVPVEIQIRDKAMDLWASIEHKIKYKRLNPSPEIVKKFWFIAKSLAELDEDIMRIRDEVASNE